MFILIIGVYTGYFFLISLSANVLIVLVQILCEYKKILIKHKEIYLF